MTTIDKIQAEIKKRLNWKGKIQTSYYMGCRDELKELLSFLDTLEEPVGKTCKTCGFYENNCPFIRGKFISYPNKVCKDYTFSTLKAEQEPVSDDLEEAAEKYAEDEMMAGLAERAFKAGAEWMKKQIPMPEDTVIFQKGVEEGKRLMMEDAVEGTVIELGETYKDLSLSVNAKELNQVLQPLGVGDGNKVKIIIVKEEEQ